MLYMTKSLFNKLYLKKQLYGLRMKEGTTVLKHLNFFNKVISELLTVDVKIDEENKVLILLSSISVLFQSHMIISSPSCSTIRKLSSWRRSRQLLSNKIRKRTNQEEQTGSGLVVTGRKEREGRKGPSSSKACHFCHRKDHWKNDCKYRREWLKKKGQAAEADIASV